MKTPFPGGGLQHNMDSGPNCGPVCFGSNEFKLEPMIGCSGIHEERIPRKIAGVRPAQRAINILISIVIEIGKAHAVSFLNVASPGRSGDFLKEFAAGVAEHAVRDEGAKIRIAGAAVKIHPSVIVEV